jgi:hypothetical protein
LEQGDQIGRIFAYWAIIFFGIFLRKFLAYVRFPKVSVLYLFRQKTGWATFRATFFTNSSGHPGLESLAGLSSSSFDFQF